MIDTTALPQTERIAKIDSTFLGYEDHGILTAMLQVNYGGSGQGIGGYALDYYDDDEADRKPTEACGRWVAGVLRACGVDSWEKVKGRTVIVLCHGDGWNAKPIGIKPLPTEPGRAFYFAEQDAE